MFRLAIALLSLALAMASMTITPTQALAGQVTISVDTTEDTFDGSCDDGDCSLRDAVKSAPAGALVSVPPGFYALTVTGGGGVEVGSIELRRRVEIVGEGETGTFIDAAALGAPAFTAAPRTDADVPFTLSRLTIFGARDPSVTGGAVRVTGGSLRLRASTLAVGIAERGGGVAVDPGASLTLVDSLVIGNEATTSGGGIWNEGTLDAVDSAIVGNRAVDGAGIGSAASSSTALEAVTVAENVASGTGGGLHLDGPASMTAVAIGDNEAARGGGITASGPVDVARSIVADNRADRARQCDGALRSAGDNVDHGHGCGFDQASDLEDTDPMLRRLGPYGGLTPTMALSVRSPAVDLAGSCGGRDQRGAPRDRRCDAGAYEVVRCLGTPVNIVGTPGDDELSGGRGPDSFLGLGGDDEFQGSIGADRACGGPGDDLLIAGPGDDRFSGDAGRDRVKGESGADRLWGGPGRDGLVGGPGRDRCERDGADRDPRGCERLVPTHDLRATPRPT